MSHTYFDTTGVLRFAGPVNITPVILALFGPFELDASYPGGSEAYIARISESSWTDWDSIVESIEGQLEALGIAAPDPTEADSSIEELLSLLGARFDCSEAVEELADDLDFDDEPDLQDLFELAMLFDDGHGLVAVSFETGWHCDKPKLFEFGGAGEHHSKNIHACASSNLPVQVGQEVDRALEAGEVGQAAQALATHARDVLEWAVDEQLRASAQSLLVASLCEDPGAPINVGEREFDLFVGIGAYLEGKAPLWLHVRLMQSLLDVVHRRQRLVAQHGLSEVQGRYTARWQGKHAMTCGSLVVDQTSFYWTAYPQHGEHAVESARIGWPLLKAAIDNAIAAGSNVVLYGIDSDDVLQDCLAALRDLRPAS